MDVILESLSKWSWWDVLVYAVIPFFVGWIMAKVK